MKKILVVYTGGTICSAPQDGQRKLHTTLAKRAILANFSAGPSRYAGSADQLFEDSRLCKCHQTLSENMTVAKLDRIVDHLKTFDLNDYAGVILLHGTDTLAYTAALLSFLYADTPVPILLVSGNRPPMDPESNANENFRVAVELILGKIPPNVYVPYQNSDGKIWLHLGSTVMQCANFSEDFTNASANKMFAVDGDHICSDDLLQQCAPFSTVENASVRTVTEHFDHLRDDALLIYPYTGLRYSNILIDHAPAIVHGTYHSGTVCTERNDPAAAYSSNSVLWLLKKCNEQNIPVFIAPCKMGAEQYSSVFDAACFENAVLLNMTTEAAYGKLLIGISCGLKGEPLVHYMRTQLNHEMMH